MRTNHLFVLVFHGILSNSCVCLFKEICGHLPEWVICDHIWSEASFIDEACFGVYARVTNLVLFQLPNYFGLMLEAFRGEELGDFKLVLGQESILLSKCRVEVPHLHSQQWWVVYQGIKHVVHLQRKHFFAVFDRELTLSGRARIIFLVYFELNQDNLSISLQNGLVCFNERL